MGELLRSRWPSIVVATVVVALMLTRGAGARRVIGFALLAEAALVSLLFEFGQFDIGGSLWHPPPMTLREPGATKIIWMLVALAVIVTPAITVLQIVGARRRGTATKLQRYNRIAVTVVTYTLSAAVFAMGGMIFGSIFGMGGRDGLDERSINSNASAGGMLGAILGIVVASRARKTSTAKREGRNSH